MSDGKEFPSDKADKFVVRFPDGMREKIRAAAEANNRSMNAEIIARLQASFVAESEFHIGPGLFGLDPDGSIPPKAIEGLTEAATYAQQLADALRKYAPKK